MVDFFMISTRPNSKGTIEIYPRFIIDRSTDLMIRGGDFYAVWLEDKKMWSTDERDAIRLIDRELDKYLEENRDKFNSNVKVLHLWDAETGKKLDKDRFREDLGYILDGYKEVYERLYFTNDYDVYLNIYVDDHNVGWFKNMLLIDGTDFDKYLPNTYLTPVPGSVGLLTGCNLLDNVIVAYNEMRNNK